MDDVLKKVEALEKKIKELESKLKNDFLIFGRNYNQVGSSSSDFLIKTKGLIKLQWGNKFIDLIKDGKINCDAKFIYSGKPGVKNGLYVTDDGSVYLKFEDLPPIPLVGEVGNTYVSFVDELETTSEGKYLALKNIGFLYPNLDSIDDSALKNGIIYVESELKLYIVRDGNLTEFKFEFPNPFTELFIIAKNDTNIGSLYIKGSGIQNSLAFDGLYIFTEEGESFIQSDGNIKILIDGSTILNITREKTTINNIVESDTFLSIGATYDSGFMLFNTNEGSTLIVDNLIVRNKKDAVGFIYPTIWSVSNNIITRTLLLHNEEENISGYTLYLKYENKYKSGDLIYVYGEVEEKSFTRLIKIPFVVGEIDPDDIEEGVIPDNIINVSVLTDLLEEELPEDIILSGHTTFLINSELRRTSEHNIDLVECKTFEEEQSLSSIKGRYGILDELELKERDNVTGTEPEIKGQGIYLEQGYYKKAGYVNDPMLAEEDDSTQFASTEWVRKLLLKLLPIGSIIMFNGLSEIPDCWAVCDGSNGTPDLINKFIKGGTNVGEIGGDSLITLTTDNLPKHTHTASVDITNSTVPDSWKDQKILTYKEIYYNSFDLGGGNHWIAETGYEDKTDKGIVVIDVEDMIKASQSDGSITIDETGNGGSFNVEPPYYTLIYIMKIK